jgi:hypothetical protein
VSFTPIQFVYTPPPTVDSRAGAAAIPAPAPPVSAAAGSLAAGLLDQTAGLKAAGLYLQTLVLAKTQGIGITVNPDSDPALATALSRLYSQSQPPAGMTVDMYNNLLDTEAAIMRADMALTGSPSLLQVSPAQKADLLTANQGFEDAMVATGAAAYQLPLLLRQLKGNDIMVDGLTTALQAYPVLQGSTYAPAPATAAVTIVSSSATGITNLAGTATVVPGSPDTSSFLSSIDQPVMDVNSATAAAIGTRLDSLQAQYAAINTLCTGVDKVTQNIAGISTQLLGADLQDLIMIVSMISGMKLLFHKPTLTELKGSVGLLLLPRLVAEGAVFNSQMDRIIQSVTAPAQTMLASLNALTGEVVSVGNEVAYLVAQGGLTGLIGSHISGTKQPPTPQREQELDAMPKAMGMLTGYLNWGIQELTARATEIESSFFRAMDRRLLATGGQLDLMSSLQQIDALIALLQSIIQAQQSGSTPTVSSSNAGVIQALSAPAATNLPAPTAAVARLLTV